MVKKLKKYQVIVGSWKTIIHAHNKKEAGEMGEFEFDQYVLNYRYVPKEIDITSKVKVKEVV